MFAISGFQTPDNRFIICYLTKYACGAEEGFAARLRQKTPQTCDVLLHDEKRRKRHSRPARAHGETITTPEMTAHCLQLPSITATFRAVHVNTAPPEDRYVTMKAKVRVPEAERGATFGDLAYATQPAPVYRHPPPFFTTYKPPMTNQQPTTCRALNN